MNQTSEHTQDNAPIYNIRAVVTQTGLNPATIRAWERRYGLPCPSRTAGGHRQYSQHDVNMLKWLIARQEEGVSISHAIDMWRSYADREEDPLEAAVTVDMKPIPQVDVVVEGDQVDRLRQEWISACLAFERRAAERILANAFALFDAETVCIELLQRGLAELGRGWHEGEVTVQQEHFASELSMQRLEMLVTATPAPTRPERIIVAAAPEEHHVFSPLLLTFLLRQRGWDVVYLGADVPTHEIESTIRQVGPELIIVAAQLFHTAATLKELAVAVRSHGVPLAFGGLVFNQMPGLRQLIPGHFLGESLEEAVQSVSALVTQRRAPEQWTEPGPSYMRVLTQYCERRALIESHVWGTFIATNRATDHLSAINHSIAQVIEAALKLGDIGLLGSEIAWIERVMVGYRLSKTLLADYMLAYYQAARIHLGESAAIVVDWLSRVASDGGAKQIAG